MCVTPLTRWWAPGGQKQCPNLLQSLVPSKPSANTWLTLLAVHMQNKLDSELIIQTPFKWAFQEVQLDLAGSIQNQRQRWVSDPPNNTRRCQTWAGKVLSHSLSGLLLLSAGVSSLPCRAPGPQRSHAESRQAVCVFPQEVLALLAQHQPSGLAPVPPGIFRDQLQFIILASYSDFLTTCSQIAKLRNLSWRRLFLEAICKFSKLPWGSFIFQKLTAFLKYWNLIKITNMPFIEWSNS